MHDVVIRGGTVVDGTGAPAARADVAVSGDRVVAVGQDLGPARREVDAGGCHVVPGWVDIHSHYDGRATWDPVLAPSGPGEVTTTVLGNCGVGFAPGRVLRAAHWTGPDDEIDLRGLDRAADPDGVHLVAARRAARS